VVDDLVVDGLVQVGGDGRIRLTRRGRLLADAVVRRLVAA
jgi:Mn-dependent DtxR family transcriptional regulator